MTCLFNSYLSNIEIVSDSITFSSMALQISTTLCINNFSFGSPLKFLPLAFNLCDLLFLFLTPWEKDLGYVPYLGLLKIAMPLSWCSLNLFHSKEHKPSLFDHSP